MDRRQTRKLAKVMLKSRLNPSFEAASLLELCTKKKGRRDWLPSTPLSTDSRIIAVKQHKRRKSYCWCYKPEESRKVVILTLSKIVLDCLLEAVGSSQGTVGAPTISACSLVCIRSGILNSKKYSDSLRFAKQLARGPNESVSTPSNVKFHLRRPVSIK